METKAKRVPAGAQKNEIIVVVRRMNKKKKKGRDAAKDSN